MRESGVLDGILMFLSVALIVAGAVGVVLLVRRSGRMGALGNVGLVLGCAGLAVLVAAALVQALFYDGDFLYMPYFVVPGLATLVVGFLLLGIAILRSGVLPTWRAILLVIGALAMTGANEQTVMALLFIPFGIAWIAVGHAIWSAANNEPQLSGGAADRSVIQP